MLKDDLIHIKVKDYSVSGEIFTLYMDPATEVLFTVPKPPIDILSSYYESEDYISHTDQNRTLIEKLYQAVRKIALQNKLALLKKYASRGKLLDIGAGTGDFLAAAKSDNWIITGIEPDKNARDIAKTKGVKLLSDQNTIITQQFDVITMWHVLEHVPELEKQIRDLKDMLTPKGTLFIAVPNYKSYDAKVYGSHWAAYDVPRHLWHFSKVSISKVFSKEQMTVVKTIPMPFDSFYVSMLSEKYKSGNINYFKAFYNGLVSNLKAKTTGEYSSLIYVIRNVDSQ